MIQQLLFPENNYPGNNNYKKFVLYRDLHEFQCNSFTRENGNRAILNSRKCTLAKSDKKIVKALMKCFSNNYTEFNIFLIFNRAFENSYSEAIIKYCTQQEKRRMTFLNGYYDYFSITCNLPKEIISSIVKIQSFLAAQPSCMEFQAKMWNFVSPIEDKNEIIKQLKK